MSDKVQVGTFSDGRRFFVVDRNGRKMPLLNGNGMVPAWRPFGAEEEKEFGRVLRAMENPSKMKDVTPARPVYTGFDPAQPGTDNTVRGTRTNGVWNYDEC